MIDQPTTIRSGEELPVDRLGPWLDSLGLPGAGEWSVRQFPSGFSNLTYFLKRGEAEFVLRRPPHGARAKGGHNMWREYRVMRDLASAFPRVPKMYGYCENESILGAPFFLMERVQGAILRAPNHPGYLQLSHEDYQTLSEAWLNTFVELHQVDYQAAGLGDFGRPAGYTHRQVTGWSERYLKAKTDDVADINRVMAWLNKNMPPDGPPALIHNDYKYDNVVFAPDDWSTIRAVLDWEMATIGDPLLDLGSSLAYWVNHDEPEAEKRGAILPTIFPGNPTRQEIIQQYAVLTGLKVGDFVFPMVYGLFKLAVVVQQIYWRYANGYTTDKRFAGMDRIAHSLCAKALGMIDSKSV